MKQKSRKQRKRQTESFTKVVNKINKVLSKEKVDWGHGNTQWEERILNLARVTLMAWEQLGKQNPDLLLGYFANGQAKACIRIFDLSLLVDCYLRLAYPINVPLENYLTKLPYFEPYGSYTNETLGNHNYVVRQFRSPAIEALLDKWLDKQLTQAKKHSLQQKVPHSLNPDKNTVPRL